MRESKGFTLVEVLVVLALFGVSVSLLVIVFSRGVDFSLSLEERSERVRRTALLFWDLQRKFFGAERIYIEGDSVYMVTSGGDYFPGMVRCAYVFRDGNLLYYEDRDVGGDIYGVTGKGKIVGRFRDFRVVAVEGNRELSVYDGLPSRVRVYVDDKVFTFEVSGGRVLSGLRKP
ncbi:MAG: prepilin-type N-terminal cleavage/methylation domain-containing protein [Aquificota bacterium]|nr:prepilin-type N-terminal cleavage/methylation domain-containing protein [Aquificota bacterium]